MLADTSSHHAQPAQIPTTPVVSNLSIHQTPTPRHHYAPRDPEEEVQSGMRLSRSDGRGSIPLAVGDLMGGNGLAFSNNASSDFQGDARPVDQVACWSRIPYSPLTGQISDSKLPPPPPPSPHTTSSLGWTTDSYPSVFAGPEFSHFNPGFADSFQTSLSTTQSCQQQMSPTALNPIYGIMDAELQPREIVDNSSSEFDPLSTSHTSPCSPVCFPSYFDSSAMVTPTTSQPEHYEDDGYGQRRMMTQYAPFLNTLPAPHTPSSVMFVSDLDVTRSRAETLFNVSLYIPPELGRFSRLHLPRHTVAPPKHLALNSTSAIAPDTLNLDVSVVCESAMNDPDHPEYRLNALHHAAVRPTEIQPRGEATPARTTTNTPTKSSSGGGSSISSSKKEWKNKDAATTAIAICPNCIQREHQRANRNKVSRNPEVSRQRAIWNSYERDRLVIFQSSEFITWKPCPCPRDSDKASQWASLLEKCGGDSGLAGFKSVELAMRIACYCRHHGGERGRGFQVIFTLKDSEGRCVAQEMSTPIMIADSGSKDAGAGALSKMSVAGKGSGQQQPQQQQQQQQRPWSRGLRCRSS